MEFKIKMYFIHLVPVCKHTSVERQQAGRVKCIVTAGELCYTVIWIGFEYLLVVSPTSPVMKCIQ